MPEIEQTRKKMLVVMPSSAIFSAFLIFFLSVDSLPLPIRAQIIPMTSLLALFFFPFTMGRFHVTPLFKIVIAFTAFVMLHSAIGLFIDFTIQEKETVRLIAWMRQVVALASGLSVFLVLRNTLTKISSRCIVYVVLAGSLLPLVLALCSVLWVLKRNAVAGTIVTNVRRALIPLGWTDPSRASGLSLEPASFAVYLAIVVIPIIFVMFMKNSGNRKLALAIFAIVMLAFAGTFSFVGFTVLFAMLAMGTFLGPKRAIHATICLALIGILVLWMSLFPSSYVVRQINMLLQGQYSGSFIDRFYSTFSPFLTMFSSYTIIGYGLGGTPTHISEIIPENARSAIIDVRWEGMVMLGTLIGRIFAETGILGLLLFMLIVLFALKELQAVLHKENRRFEKSFMLSARLALIGTLIGYAITLGSFAHPYLWFWLAIIDSRYILLQKVQNKYEP